MSSCLKTLSKEREKNFRQFGHEVVFNAVAMDSFGRIRCNLETEEARHFPWAFSPKASVKRPQANPFITGARFERAILRNGEGYLNDCPVPCPFVEKVVRREAI
ncbi:hypothetical protein CDAR_366641 [Caerostris darwini]|uniref:Uncharacterized protein n=1 Tax=Caerostris darwini TaxID=1538125 RepID=A0AAV4Q432_9ARAC|nr:hypothetical protein CDAR_366641 [Caerostris darwini]